MKASLPTLLTGVVGLWLTASVGAITIQPTFDASITNAANAVAITNAINIAILNLQSNLTDNLTVKILFTSDPTISLGQSSTWETAYAYAGYLAALRSRATSASDALALSRIPNSATDPLVNGTQIQIKQPLARLVGLDTGYGPDGFDATITFNMPLMNFTRPPADPQKYDLVATTEHEINEVLGFASNLGYGFPNDPIAPVDLFRYTTNLVRTYTTNGDDAYLSIDGTNLLARFNQQADGDYHDFWSATATWSPPGTPPGPQVQDAIACPGGFQDEGPNELLVLDVIGYTLANTPPPAPPALTIVPSGANQVTLAWSNSSTGFVLQERAAFTNGTWTAAASGGNNPAVASATAPQKFFRLFKAAPSGIHPRPVELSAPTQRRLVTHRLLPRLP